MKISFLTYALVLCTGFLFSDQLSAQSTGEKEIDLGVHRIGVGLNYHKAITIFKNADEDEIEAELVESGFSYNVNYAYRFWKNFYVFGAYEHFNFSINKENAATLITDELGKIGPEPKNLRMEFDNLEIDLYKIGLRISSKGSKYLLFAEPFVGMASLKLPPSTATADFDDSPLPIRAKQESYQTEAKLAYGVQFGVERKVYQNLWVEASFGGMAANDFGINTEISASTAGFSLFSFTSPLHYVIPLSLVNAGIGLSYRL